MVKQNKNKIEVKQKQSRNKLHGEQRNGEDKFKDLARKILFKK